MKQRTIAELRLNHTMLHTPNPAELSAFYQKALGMNVTRHGEEYICTTTERCIVLAEGKPKTLGSAENLSNCVKKFPPLAASSSNRQARSLMSLHFLSATRMATLLYLAYTPSITMEPIRKPYPVACSMLPLPLMNLKNY
jgi:hypothetical protein